MLVGTQKSVCNVPNIINWTVTETDKLITFVVQLFYHYILKQITNQYGLCFLSQNHYKTVSKKCQLCHTLGVPVTRDAKNVFPLNCNLGGNRSVLLFTVLCATPKLYICMI